MGAAGSMPGMLPTTTYAQDVPRPADPPKERLSDELRADLLGRDSFVPVFILALVSVMGFPVADRYHWGFLVTVPLLAATILLALHRSHVHRHFVQVASILVLAVGLGSLVAASTLAASGTETRWLTGVLAALTAGLVILVLPAIMREAFRHRRISINTLAAGVTAYLFIGFFFTSVFRLIWVIQGVPFFHTAADNPQGGEFQYFSFVTLTTLGYGDYAPATDPGRAAAVLEAILGQVFLVTAVARIMSLMGQERERSPAPPDAGPATGPVAELATGPVTAPATGPAAELATGQAAVPATSGGAANDQDEPAPSEPA